MKLVVALGGDLSLIDYDSGGLCHLRSLFTGVGTTTMILQ